MNTIGFAAEKIARSVEKEGATVIGKPMGFIVGDKKGPLLETEKARAAEWAQDVVTHYVD